MDCHLLLRLSSGLMLSPAAFKSIKVFDFNYAYLDSGAPGSANYTTWVIIHGMGFNAAVFEKLLPLAPTYNLRIVSVNRRGYPPSSGFQEDELKGIGHGKKFEEAESFYCAQGTEIATFLAKFATEQRIPSQNGNSPTGGIVLIGWSVGGIHVLAVLAYADELPENTQATLQKYLHTILFHGETIVSDGTATDLTIPVADPSPTAFGIPTPDGDDVSLWSETDNHKRFDALFDWVTAYFTHKNVTSGNIDDLQFNDPSDTSHSFHELSYDQRAKYTHLEAFTFTGCDGKLLLCDATAYIALTKRALFDKAHAEAFPNVRVRCMSGGTSGGIFIWVLWVLKKCAENPKGLYGQDAEKVRDIKIVHQAEGNHCSFWDEPDRTIQHYCIAIKI